MNVLDEARKIRVTINLFSFKITDKQVSSPALLLVKGLGIRTKQIGELLADKLRFIVFRIFG
jgi:hypothetical protein